MDTRGKTNAEFRNEVNEALARHESSFDQVNATLQAVLTELQALREAFEELSHQVDGLPEPFLISCFIAGLRGDIRLDVKIKQPRMLASAIGVARLIEERNLLQKKTTTPSCIPMTATLQKGPNPSTGILGPNPTQRSNNSLNPSSLPVHRITNQEARERREKGLCYYCDEKYFQGH
ncbi:hypothetical protein VitviT2T_021504 [Vitis vinifera]|uniref:Retrotransposon gag domain-containing protein n=1 Tax=Vitis vinifera TaxID=29760 RepID=A0ABY9D771_VITVI|nr:hypothetical protein VitviT2T_021504 [Vitis vinifera]